MKIALVSLQSDAERVPPVGLVYLATYLNERAGIKKDDIRIFEANYCDDIEKGLDEFKPDMIGFSAMTVDYGKVIEFAKKIKPAHNVPFIIGGVHISSLPESLDKIFDVGVIGEGEITLAELAKAWTEGIEYYCLIKLRKINGLVFYNGDILEYTPPRPPIPNLDDLPIPNFKFISQKYFQKEEIPSISDVGIKGWMMTSRGCIYKCIFCSTARFWGNMRFHSPEYTAKMAKSLIENYGVDFLKVIDDLFTVSTDRLKEIKIQFDKYNILNRIEGIECQPRANLMTDELCLAMKDLKIKTLNFGFESGSDRILKWLKQDSVDVEINMNAILLCKKHGFNAYGSLMYGSPGETIEDMEMTNSFIDFAINNGAKYLWSFVSTPFPATPFWDIALQRGKVSNNMDWNLLSHHTEMPLLLDDNISQEEFQKVFKEGKAKLRGLKIQMIKEFVIKHPFAALKMMAIEPSYYISRAFKQIFKQ